MKFEKLTLAKRLELEEV